jgi:ADP-ribose pyrophosphatase
MTSSSDKPRLFGVDLIQDVSRLSSPVDGFIRRHRHRVKTTFDDGTRTETYVVDFVDRTIDRRDAAVVVVVGEPKPDPAQTLVLLRSQLRYPVYLADGRPAFLELIAGVIEMPESLESCVIRELAEEAGIAIGPELVAKLGAPYYPLAASITERLHPSVVQLPDETLRAVAGTSPPGDGSPFEEGAELVVHTLGEALAMIDRGQLDDAKTEIGLRRYWARLTAGGPAPG